MLHRDGTDVGDTLTFECPAQFADFTLQRTGLERPPGQQRGRQCPDLLVAPVLEPGARRRRVYLPAGARWVEAATGVEHAGGRWVEADAPLDVIPVFLRDGSHPELVGRWAAPEAALP